MWLQRTASALKRVIATLAVGAVSGCAAVVTVLSDDKAPVPWWAPSAWVKWWSEDPNSAAIALATAAVAAFSLGLAIYQAFFSKAARESERRIRGYVEREGRQTRDHIDAHHDRSEAASQTRHEDVTDRLARIEAAISPGGLDRAEAAGLNKAQVETLLTAFAHEGVPADQAEALLLQSARELTELRARLARATNDEPEIAALLQAAAEAIDIPDLRRADELLSRAEEADLAEGARRIDRAARTIARRAELARSQARLLDAADLYGRAAGVISPHDTEAAWGYRLHEASALQAHGDLFPGLDVLRRAVTALRDRALPLAPEQDRPAQWAMTQNNLGIALQSLGNRAGGPEGLAALNEAVAAYRAALRVRTEADMPAQWAATQNNLGNALRSLGDRAGGPEGLAALNEAVAAYRAALRVYTEADMPANWAMTQNNLGLALRSLGERAGGSEGLAALNEAVAACRAALRIRTEADMPADWAATQNNLGIALQRLGERAGGSEGQAALNEAVAAYRAALRVRTEADMPAQWAMTQNNLGIALRSLGDRAGGSEGQAALNEAVAAYRAALRVRTEADMPADWAATQNNLGNALQSLGDRAGGPEGLAALNEAVAAYRAALRVRTEADMPADWAMTIANLCLVYETQSEITRDPGPVCAAVADMDRVIAVFEAMQAGFYIEKARRNRALMAGLCRELGGTCAD